MNNRYKYDNRRRTYGNRDKTTNGASSIVSLVFITIVLIVWIVSLKADISQLSDEKQMLRSENTELAHKVDSISKALEESRKIVPIVEDIKPKKIFKRIVKDTTSTKAVKVIEKIELKAIVADTTKKTN
jgi:hypothetical protein